MNQKSLTVIIPTWNRARYLEKNLEILDSYLKRGLDFKILVCNNGSTDNTSKVLEKWVNHPQIAIINHPENIKYDRNVASGYLNFDTDFCFCLGDTKSLSFESLERIIKTINEENLDALVIKTTNSIIQQTEYYDEINKILLELGWVLPNISSCVLSNKLISIERCERYFDSQFIHYGVFVDGLCALKKIKVKYDSTIKLELINFAGIIRPHGWSSKVCSIWGKTWMAFVMTFPWKVSLETKLNVIRNLNKFEKHLSLGVFVFAKINSDKAFFEDYKENRKYMPLLSSTPLLFYDIIAFIPDVFFQLIRPLLRRVTKYKQRIR